MCGGGGSSQVPAQQTVTQVTIPPEIMPYAKKLLGTAENLAYNQPYQTYGGQRVAGLNPLQMQAMQQIQQQQIAPQIGQATGFAGLAGLQAQKFGNYKPAEYQGMDVSYRDTQAPQLQQFQMSPAQMVAAGVVTPQQLEQFQMDELGKYGVVSAPGGGGSISARDIAAERYKAEDIKPYMSSYMQGVVDLEKEGAIKDYARQLPGLAAAGVRAGARGGTREALLESEGRRNLAQGLRSIQTTGSQRAFESAQAQYAADRARALQAEMANQQAGLTAGAANLQAQNAAAQMGLQASLANQQMAYNRAAQNLAAKLGVQQLGAQQGLQAGLANQQTGLQAALANQAAGLTTGQANLQAALQTQGLGANLGMQSQLANQQAQLQAQQQALAQRQFGAQFGEQSRQFGQNLGLQGIQQQLAAAGLLGNLGQQQFGQQQAINQSQLGAGAQMQQLEQARLQAAYEDFLNRQRYPYQQLGFMSDLIRGTPTAGGIQSIYGSQSSPLGALAGLGGLYMAGRQG